MRSNRRRYVRRMPKIYGNLQTERRKLPSFSPLKAIRVLLPWALLAGAIYTVFWSSVFTVATVEVRGATLADAEAIKASVPMGGSMWTFPKGIVESAVLEQPAVEEVRVLRGLPKSILIEVTEREAKAVWLTPGFVSLLDNRGRVFLQYPVDQVPGIDTSIGKSLITLPTVVDTSGLSADLGSQVASSLFLSFVGEVNTGMESLLPLWEVDRFEVAATTYDITMRTKPGLVVRLNTLGDAGVQIRNLARLERDGKLTGATSVDLRVDRWAYVK